jgi:hypothetical protein
MVMLPAAVKHGSAGKRFANAFARPIGTPGVASESVAKSARVTVFVGRANSPIARASAAARLSAAAPPAAA